MDRPTVILSAMLVTLLMGAATVSAQAVAQDSARTFTISPGYRFTEKSGEALYNATCAGCHMPDGKGAQGAGHYPALADNPAVEAVPYIIGNVLHGRKAMPSIRSLLSSTTREPISAIDLPKVSRLARLEVCAEFTWNGHRCAASFPHPPPSLHEAYGAMFPGLSRRGQTKVCFLHRG
jgi:cytochrome c5